MNDRVFDPARAHVLEDPERLTWLPPAEVIARLDLRPGMVVADLGAGTGYFAIPAAAEIAPGGKVLAVDLQPAMLEKFRAKLEALGGPANIELVQGEALRTNLPARSADVVLLANVWHELDAHDAVLREVDRILKPGGRIAILDWRPDVDRPPGPPLEHRIAPEQVARLFEAHGWSARKPVNIGRFSYLVVAEARR